MIAEKTIQEISIQPELDRFELVEEVDAKTMVGEVVKIRKSLGFYNLQHLNHEKDNYQAQMDSINEKIAAIELLSSPVELK